MLSRWLKYLMITTHAITSENLLANYYASIVMRQTPRWLFFTAYEMIRRSVACILLSSTTTINIRLARNLKSRMHAIAITDRVAHLLNEDLPAVNFLDTATS
jgi:hypothetical protein